MRATIVVDVALGVVVAAAVLAPLLHVLAPFEGGERPLFARSVLLAFGGLLLAAVANVLLGWLPLVGVLAAPAAWILLVRGVRGVDWPTAVGVGAVAWALTVLAYRLAGVIA